VGVLAVLVADGTAQTLSTLYVFNGQGTDGATPTGLTRGNSGALYGTTLGVGGTSGLGTVFELTPPTAPDAGWKYTILHRFTGQNEDGSAPYSGVIFDANGALYGTTSAGGNSGKGTIFQLTPAADGAWIETVLHSFTGQNGDGATPYAGLTFGANGALYGTTSTGGTSGAGTVFEMIPPVVAGGMWNLTVLYSFTDQNGDGGYPLSTLAIGPIGNLYGTTSEGGAAGEGTIFEVKPPASGGEWSETVVHSFAGTNDGSDPQTGIVAGKNGFYGTTFSGGMWNDGTVFELMPPAAPGGAWSETVLHSFHCCDDGSFPTASLLVGRNGDLFGATGTGGGSKVCVATPESYGCGTVFALQSPTTAGGAWTETILHSFTGRGSDGEFPGTALLFGENRLYGTTSDGGATFGWGTIFQLTP
jgi:uncharacterized repeat protein (TIGR03803 family)